jgi:hypothetical protein
MTLSPNEIVADLETAADEQAREWRDPDADVDLEDVALATRVDELVLPDNDK